MKINKLTILAPREEYWGGDFNSYTRTSNIKNKNKESFNREYLYSNSHNYYNLDTDELENELSFHDWGEDVSETIDKAFREVNDELGYDFFKTKKINKNKNELLEQRKKEKAEQEKQEMNKISQAAQELIDQIKSISFINK